MKDTPPEIERMYRERLMALSGEERVLMGGRMFEAARTMALASIPPDADEREVRRFLLHRFYGNDFTADELRVIESEMMKAWA